MPSQNEITAIISYYLKEEKKEATNFLMESTCQIG